MCEQKLIRHRWADVLIAIAEGREVQFKIVADNSMAMGWTDYEYVRHVSPLISSAAVEWRVKPKTVRKYYYAFKLKNCAPSVSLKMYKDDEHFLGFIPWDSSDVVWFQRLDNSCVEVEES